LAFSHHSLDYRAPVFVFIRRRPLLSSLLPYTTLFRSILIYVKDEGQAEVNLCAHSAQALADPPVPGRPALSDRGRVPHRAHVARSEEHTSELQSRENLVCRLLLEKKK